MIADARLASRFVLLRALGKGSSGVVYEARDEQTGAIVAVKILEARDPGVRDGLARRFERAKAVRHPNVVRLEEFFSEGEACFFTMELVAGTDLLTWVRPGPSGAVDAARLRTVIQELASALDALHEADLVHRDVKTANVRVDGTGRAVLLDLDLVVPSEEAGDREDHPVGTPAYVAPEQAAGVRIDGAADQYALGVIVYEALTGRVPFEGAPLDVLLAKQRRKPTPPTDVDHGAPADLSALCLKLLRFQPSRRPTAAAVVRKLAAGARLDLTKTEVGTLFGRAALLGRLSADLDAVDAGESALVVVEGDPATGKSAILDALASGVRASRADALLLRCNGHADRAAPLRAWNVAAERLALSLEALPAPLARAALDVHGIEHLAAMLPALRYRALAARIGTAVDERLPGRERRRRAVGALREILHRRGRRSAVVLLVDDADQADGDTFAVLRELLRPPEAPAMLVVLTAADGKGVAERLSPLAARREKLGVLNAGESELFARALLQRRGVAANEDVLAEVVRAGAGIPGRLAALLDADTSSVPAPDTPTAELFRARVGALVPSARELLRAAVLAQDGLPLDAWSEVVRDDVARLHREAGLLALVGLCRAEGLRRAGRVELRHRFIGDVALEGMDASDRATLASHVCNALEASADPPMRAIATLRASFGGPEAALAAFERAAAGAAARLAFLGEAEACRVLLDLLPATEGVRRRAVRFALARALESGGLADDAADAYAGAAEGGSAAEALMLRRRAAENLLKSGNLARGAAMAGEALRASGVSLPTSRALVLLQFVLFRFLLWLRGLRFRERAAASISAEALARLDTCWTVSIGLSMSDNIAGALLSTRLLLKALRVGEPTRVALALGSEVALLGSQGGAAWARTAILTKMASEVAARTGDERTIAQVSGFHGIALYLCGRYRESIAHCRRAEQTFREHDGSALELTTMHYMITNSLRQLGDVKELSRSVSRYIAEARSRGDLDAEMRLRVGMRAFVYMVADDADAALAEAEAVGRGWRTTSFQVMDCNQLITQADCFLYARRFHDAETLIARKDALVRRSFLLRVQVLRVFWFDLRARLELSRAFMGDRPLERLRRAKRWGERIAAERMPWSDGLASLIEGGVASGQNRAEAAADAYRRASSQFGAADMALYASIARHRLGAVLGGAEGAGLVAAANAWCAAAGVSDPRRLRGLLSPTPELEGDSTDVSMASGRRAKVEA